MLQDFNQFKEKIEEELKDFLEEKKVLTAVLKACAENKYFEKPMMECIMLLEQYEENMKHLMDMFEIMDKIFTSEDPENIVETVKDMLVDMGDELPDKYIH